AEKLFHLISTYTKRNEAFVKVTFAETNDGKDFTVARKIKKSSQGYNSIYYMDDKVVTLSDIHAKLENHNITPNSYNVMMQNDVLSITNCTPTDRRKIIDEIAGVADFDRRIEQATAELDTVDSRVQHSSLILGEVEHRLEQLKEEREVALKYKKLKDEKTILESQVTTVKFFDIRGNLEKAHENILTFTKRKKEEEVNAKDLDEQLSLINKKYEEICAVVKEKGEAHQLEVQKQAEECKGEISRKESAISYNDKQIQDRLKSIEGFKNGIELQTNKIKDEELIIETRNETIKKLEADIEEQKAQLRKINEDMTGLSENAEQQLAKRNELRKQLEDLKDRETSLIQKQAPMEADLNNLKRTLEDAKLQLERFEALKSNYSSNKESIELQVETLTQELSDCKLIQQNAMHDLDIVKNELEDIEYDIQAASKKIYMMEANKQASEEANLGHTVQTVMDAHLDGVHAPLVKLGNVDKEYSLALEIAVGGRMSHIVVDDEDVAANAIEILKSSNAGRATFIPLNRVVKAPSRLNLPKEKGVIDFAINLIDFDDEYLNAFYYAVGETLVVEDRLVAKKLIGKYRMVTLDGSLFEKSGSISGGSAKRTGLKFTVNDDELEKYKSRLKELETKRQELITRKKELESKLEKVRVDYSNAMNECSKAKVELASLTTNYESSQSQHQEKEQIIKDAEPAISKLSSELDKLESEHIKFLEQEGELQSQIDEIEKLMNEGDLKKLKEQTEGVEFEIKRLETLKLNANNDITVAHQRIAFNQTTIATQKENIERAIKNNEESEKDKVQLTEEIKVLKVKLEEFEVQINEIKEKLGALLKERDDINNQLVNLKTKKNLKLSEIENITEQIESFKARRRELEPQLEEVRKTLIDAGIEVSDLTPPEMSEEEITSKIQRLAKRMDDLGNVNMRALEEYEEVLARESVLKEQIETLTKERLQLLEKMGGYEQDKKEAFMKTYNNINDNFKDIFHKLSDGEGTLILQEPEAPFTGGLTIEAQPRDKKKQRLEGMSGGEKSLTALAFVFAIQRYMPAPFYAFDEVDANLDGINVEKLASIVQAQSKDTQFIVVSHRKPMIESANRT
ncbi:MAG: chromosome segregation protein SMC, partial [Candidatus Gastranaerophilaceae bacterium]